MSRQHTLIPNLADLGLTPRPSTLPGASLSTKVVANLLAAIRRIRLLPTAVGLKAAETSRSHGNDDPCSRRQCHRLSRPLKNSGSSRGVVPRKLLYVASIIALVSHGSAFASDASADFVTLSNPNGVWEYGYSIGDGNYTFNALNTAFDDTGGAGWQSSTYISLGAPSIWRNTGSDVSHGVAPGQISLHPGPDAFSPTILRFVAPTAGNYRYSGRFYAGDSGVMNGQVVLDGDLATPLAIFASTDGDPSFAGLVALNAGDTLDVAVGNNGNFLFGNTPVDFAVAAVPEPSVSLLLVCGVSVLLLKRRRVGIPRRIFFWGIGWWLVSRLPECIALMRSCDGHFVNRNHVHARVAPWTLRGHRDRSCVRYLDGHVPCQRAWRAARLAPARLFDPPFVLMEQSHESSSCVRMSTFRLGFLQCTAGGSGLSTGHA